MEFARLGIILFTHNYEACVAFYTKTLGLPVIYAKDEPGSHLTCCDFGGAYLMIEVGGPDPVTEKSVEQNPTKLRFNVADVEAAARVLEGRGIEVRREAHDWGTIANFVDPDGNVCSLRDEASFSAR